MNKEELSDIVIYKDLLKIVSDCQLNLLTLNFSIQLRSCNPPLNSSDYAYRYEPEIDISASGNSLGEAASLVISAYVVKMQHSL